MESHSIIRIGSLRYIIAFVLVNISVLLSQEDVYISLNQSGFLPGDLKSGVIQSKGVLSTDDFYVINLSTDKPVYQGKIIESGLRLRNFGHNYIFRFDELSTFGLYAVQIGTKRSNTFWISEEAFDGIADTLLTFFRVQRCGYTGPYMHRVCHISDATSLIDGDNVSRQIFDVTGGWHDAGDYIKFLNTTAYSTYMLLFSFHLNPRAYDSDVNKNGQIDILEEAKVGLDWLLRCDSKKGKLVSQVQNLNDHEVGWRMPEDDPLTFDRPAYLGIGKNLIGIYAAALALGARIWSEQLDSREFASECLYKSEHYYRMRNDVPDIDSSGSGMYRDHSFYGKLALAAVELYNTTGKEDYLDEAFFYGRLAGSDYWWSWGDINSLAHFRLAEHDSSFVKYIRNNLNHFDLNSKKRLFGEGTELKWGSNNTLLGVTLQALLYKSITGDNQFDELATIHRDYILGRNQWGLSFIHKIGTEYAKNFHHQVAYFNGGYLPGGFSAGPVTEEYLNNMNIEFSGKDQYAGFQDSEAAYRDDRNDYITNEPTISANATAICVFGFYVAVNR